MKKKVLCTALAVTMLITTTASATAKPWWLSKYRVTFDNELGIVGNVTLTFASDGGSFIRPITKRYVESISLESYIPTKYGYTFKGWFTDPRTTLNQVTTFKFTKPDVLYAKWEKNLEEPIYQNMIRCNQRKALCKNLRRLMTSSVVCLCCRKGKYKVRR